jgi:hypothetical protein
MTTQLKETDPSEFTQHTMTEQEILAHPEFIQAKDVLEHRSLKPSQAMEISFPRDRWSVESIATYLRCLAPYTKGRGYSMDMYADDKAEYLSFTNMRPDSDSEMEVLSNLTDERIMTLPVEALKHFVQTESEVSPDSEIETDYQFYRGGAKIFSLSPQHDDLAVRRAKQYDAMAETVLKVAYERSLPWAVAEMHDTAPIGRA